jgi:hypothetical protein
MLISTRYIPKNPKAILSPIMSVAFDPGAKPPNRILSATDFMMYSYMNEPNGIVAVCNGRHGYRIGQGRGREGRELHKIDRDIHCT